MENLIKGIGRYRAGAYERDKDLYIRLAQGQKPHTLLITCSDSRIQPDVITATEPGELFILRNVGNIVPPHGCGQPEAEAVIEYATVALGVRDVVVCGHSHCGAMKAMLEPHHLAELPAVAAWLAHAEETRSRVAAKYPDLQGNDLLNAAIRENVLVQVERVKSLPYVAARIAAGALEVHAWVYQFESGDILRHDEGQGSFVPIVVAEAARELAS